MLTVRKQTSEIVNMCEFPSTELKRVWQTQGNNNYEFRGYMNGTNYGQMAYFRDNCNRKNFVGKITKYPKVGESYYWARFCHVNLMPLHECCKMNNGITVFMMPRLGMTLYERIRDLDFSTDPKSFCRKKAYLEDILHGLNYLHKKRLCLMNLNEKNLWIDTWNDRAVIGNFTCLSAFPKATIGSFEVSELYCPPEFIGFPPTSYVEAEPAEIWMYGVLVIQVFCPDFLQNKLSAKFSVSHAVLAVVGFLKNLSSTFIELYPALNLKQDRAQEMKTFLDKIMNLNPHKRMNSCSVTRELFWKDSTRCCNFVIPDPPLYTPALETERPENRQLPTTNPFPFAAWENKKKPDFDDKATIEGTVSTYGDVSMNNKCQVLNAMNESTMLAVRQDLAKAASTIHNHESLDTEAKQDTKIPLTTSEDEESSKDIECLNKSQDVFPLDNTSKNAKDVFFTEEFIKKLDNMLVKDIFQEESNINSDRNVVEEVLQLKYVGDDTQVIGKNAVSVGCEEYEKEEANKIADNIPAGKNSTLFFLDNSRDDHYSLNPSGQTATHAKTNKANFILSLLSPADREMFGHDLLQKFKEIDADTNNHEKKEISHVPSYFTNKEDFLWNTSSEEKKEDNADGVANVNCTSLEGFASGLSTDTFHSLQPNKGDKDYSNSINNTTEDQPFCLGSKEHEALLISCGEKETGHDSLKNVDQEFIDPQTFACEFFGDSNHALLLDKKGMLDKLSKKPLHASKELFKSTTEEHYLSPSDREIAIDDNYCSNEKTPHVYFNPNYSDPNSSNPLLVEEEVLDFRVSVNEDGGDLSQPCRVNSAEKVVPVEWDHFCGVVEPAHITEEYTASAKRRKKKKKKRKKWRCTIL